MKAFLVSGTTLLAVHIGNVDGRDVYVIDGMPDGSVSLLQEGFDNFISDHGFTLITPEQVNTIVNSVVGHSAPATEDVSDDSDIVEDEDDATDDGDDDIEEDTDEEIKKSSKSKTRRPSGLTVEDMYTMPEFKDLISQIEALRSDSFDAPFDKELINVARKLLTLTDYRIDPYMKVNDRFSIPSNTDWRVKHNLGVNTQTTFLRVFKAHMLGNLSEHKNVEVLNFDRSRTSVSDILADIDVRMNEKMYSTTSRTYREMESILQRSTDVNRICLVYYNSYAYGFGLTDKDDIASIYLNGTRPAPVTYYRSMPNHVLMEVLKRASFEDIQKAVAQYVFRLYRYLPDDAPVDIYFGGLKIEAIPGCCVTCPYSVQGACIVPPMPENHRRGCLPVFAKGLNKPLHRMEEDFFKVLDSSKFVELCLVDEEVKELLLMEYGFDLNKYAENILASNMTAEYAIYLFMDTAVVCTDTGNYRVVLYHTRKALEA